MSSPPIETNTSPPPSLTSTSRSLSWPTLGPGGGIRGRPIMPRSRSEFGIRKPCPLGKSVMSSLDEPLPLLPPTILLSPLDPRSDDEDAETPLSRLIVSISVLHSGEQSGQGEWNETFATQSWTDQILLKLKDQALFFTPKYLTVCTHVSKGKWSTLERSAVGQIRNLLRACRGEPWEDRVVALRGSEADKRIEDMVGSGGSVQSTTYMIEKDPIIPGMVISKVYTPEATTQTATER